MLQDLLNITGVDFGLTPGRSFSHDEAKAALYVINKLFPKNRKFIGGSVEILYEGKDIDIFIRGCEEDINRAKELGFKKSNERYPIADFCSLHYQGINLIFLTSNREFQRVKMAIEVCIYLADFIHVNKDIRVTIHEAIRNYGISPKKEKKKKMIDEMVYLAPPLQVEVNLNEYGQPGW